MKYTAEQRITRARMEIITHQKWLPVSGVLMYGRSTVVENIPTACTNGRDVIYGRTFVESLTTEELRFLVLHENEHKMSRQLSTYAHLWKENPRLCNVAMDYIVNCRLLDTDDGEGFIQAPKGAMFNPKYRGWSTSQVYADLKANADDAANSMDDHDFSELGELTPEEREAIKVDIERAIREGQQLARTSSGSQCRDLSDYLESQLPWQQLLAEFITAQVTGRGESSWRKVNPRYVYQGVYFPGLSTPQVGGLLIAGDASGSTWSGNQLEGFLGEAKRIIEEAVPEFVDFIWWDTSVRAHWYFTPETYDTMIDTIRKTQGGGGTTPRCIHEWMQKEPKKYAAAIVLSDGQVGGDWGVWDNLPVLWCVNTPGVVAGVGQTIYIGG